MSHRVGLWVGAVGLLGQAVRNLIYLITGEALSDHELPIWVLKDAGYWIICAVVVYGLVGRKHGG